MDPGTYVALEGGDGCGKSTQAARLASELGALLTREPGGTTVGGLIRGVLLDPSHDAMSDRAEALLYAADRAQHLHEVVGPTLAAGRHVVSDRSGWSSVVYQGIGRGRGAEAVHRLNDWALAGRWPDLVVVLDADPAATAARLGSTLDRLERAGADFHRRVRDGFLRLAAEHADHWLVVDASGTPDEVAAAVRDAVRPHVRPRLP